MLRLADLIAANAQRLAEIEVRDNGKLLSEMLGQVNYNPEWWRYFGGLASELKGETVPLGESVLSYTRREPLGIVGAIIPWNAPHSLMAYKVAAALKGQPVAPQPDPPGGLAWRGDDWVYAEYAEPDADFDKLAAEQAELEAVIAAAGSVIELNTAGWHKPCAEAYPAPRFLELACSAGVGLVISSDAHAPGEVAREFSRAVGIAKAAGYRETMLFEKRRRRSESLG